MDLGVNEQGWGVPGIWLVCWRAHSLRQVVQQRPRAYTRQVESQAHCGPQGSGVCLVGSCLREAEAPGVGVSVYPRGPPAWEGRLQPEAVGRQWAPSEPPEWEETCLSVAAGSFCG